MWPVDPKIGQEDHGWHFTYTAGGTEFDFVVGHRDSDGPEWIGWIERSLGLLGTLFSGRRRGVTSEAAMAIRHVLAESPAVSSVAWHFHESFESEAQDCGAATPLQP